VSLDIRGPDVADLSFCDLPGKGFYWMAFMTLIMPHSSIGLIANVGANGNKSDIDLIKSFATTYIKKPSCIILLTVTCESKHAS
jgi:hypothetical protein